MSVSIRRIHVYAYLQYTMQAKVTVRSQLWNNNGPPLPACLCGTVGLYRSEGDQYRNTRIACPSLLRINLLIVQKRQSDLKTGGRGSRFETGVSWVLVGHKSSTDGGT